MRWWLSSTVLAFAAVALLWSPGDAAAQQAPAQAPAQAAAPVSKPAAGQPLRTPVPQIAKGKGDACVAPTDWMRRFHMTALNHKRDDTVHDGIRTPKFSLKACIECHAVSGHDGKPVTVKDERHFCRSCHDYAAVQVDCFECHASRPGETGSKGADASGVGGGGPHHGATAAGEAQRLGAAMSGYLEGRRP